MTGLPRCPRPPAVLVHHYFGAKHGSRAGRGHLVPAIEVMVVDSLDEGYRLWNGKIIRSVRRAMMLAVRMLAVGA